MKRTETYEEIAPLIEMCKTGKLFEVQRLIADGKPVNPPDEKPKRRKTPLQIALDTGFHSLVQLLLESGAIIEEAGYNPLRDVLWKRRFDLVQLLVEHGVPIDSVDMGTVFETWDPRIITYFIERGGDLEKDNPLAEALCYRIRTALGIFKRYEHQIPSLHDQVNIALRHHCMEGNLKWVSLMLWAGADPYARGPYPPYNNDLEDYESALEIAAYYGHTDIFKLKNIKLDPAKEGADDLLRKCCFGCNADLLKILLENGYDPKEMEDKGSSLIQSIVYSMAGRYYCSICVRDGDATATSHAREKIKMIHMIVRHGAQWMPEGEEEISHARRSFLKAADDYVMEFIWIMAEYQACTRNTMETLLRTPSIRSLLSKHSRRLSELMDSF